ncbi:MAG: hypothetical protein WEE69_01785 [Acidimicrobiia bacterium]
MDNDELDEAVRRADLDDLLRMVDTLCSVRDWDGLETLRDRCARGHETGRQLWPVASHSAYRLALEAPAPWAAAMLGDDSATFSLGPLPEVAAQAHEWHDLAPHVPRGVPAVLAAHERVMRGEDLSDVELPGPAVLEVPLKLMEWEPRYALAEYRPDEADFPMPDVPTLQPAALPPAPGEIERDEASRALVELVRAWTTGSDGHADAVSVRGGSLDAIAALGHRQARAAPIDAARAMALMAWAAASGGAHGRRAGAAAGRFGAWWAAGALTDLLDVWPPDPDRLGAELARLEFVTWEGGESDTGWRLHLAVADDARGRAWAMGGTDAR